MSPEAERVYDLAMQLPDDERRRLIDMLCDSDDAEVDPDVLAEVLRRKAEIGNGTAEVIPWAEIRQRLQRKIDDARRG